MAVPRKFLVVPNAATRELWRIAESGELDELLVILPSADINARNEHGMTALMRAARQGRPQMVRALLEHGADPNLARNDNFTALSLAAFFGHTEIVEMLLGRGAETDVETRYGTSPKMWATARSFGDVARCLEKRPTPPPPPMQQSIPKSQPPAARIEQSEPPVPFEDEPAPSPMVVRTLSEPPEIWDLVHEAPRNFNAGSAFVNRLSSMKMATLVTATALLVVLGVGTFSLALWKGAFRFNNSAAKAPEPVTSVPVTPVAASTAASSAAATSAAAPADTAAGTTSENTAGTNAVEPGANIGAFSQPEILNATPGTETATAAPRRSRPFARSRTTASNVQSVNTIENAPVPAAPAIDLKVDSQRSTGSAAGTKTTAPLSPQMISPPKSTQPKGKVIQWP
ncbi:MAG TPA: ankyrin repeat domain-containing protein [Pyrinomonadaceae bacterium]|nr:ankyrin repeat domain-containing protein [Pyrinomonadaceae bacterium]